MTAPFRVTGPLLDVLEVLLQAFGDGAEVHGWSIMKETKRLGPTVYAVIDRLEDAGWIVGRWEDEDSEPGEPRCRYYRLTPPGLIETRAVLSAHRPRSLRNRAQPARRPALVTWLCALLPGIGR